MRCCENWFSPSGIFTRQDEKNVEKDLSDCPRIFSTFCQKGHKNHSYNLNYNPPKKCKKKFPVPLVCALSCQSNSLNPQTTEGHTISVNFTCNTVQVDTASNVLFELLDVVPTFPDECTDCCLRDEV